MELITTNPTNLEEMVTVPKIDMRNIIKGVVEMAMNLDPQDRFELLNEIVSEVEMAHDPELVQSAEEVTNSSWSGYSLGDTTNLIDLQEEFSLIPAKSVIESVNMKDGALRIGEDPLFLTYTKKGTMEFMYAANGKLLPFKLKGGMHAPFIMQVMYVLGAKVEYLSTEHFSNGDEFNRFLLDVEVPELAAIEKDEDDNDKYIFKPSRPALELCITEKQGAWVTKSRRKEKYYMGMKRSIVNAREDKLLLEASSRMLSVIESGKDGVFDVNGNLEMQNDAIETAVELLQTYAPELLADR